MRTTRAKIRFNNCKRLRKGNRRLDQKDPKEIKYSHDIRKIKFKASPYKVHKKLSKAFIEDVELPKFADEY